MVEKAKVKEKEVLNVLDDIGCGCGSCEDDHNHEHLHEHHDHDHSHGLEINDILESSPLDDIGCG